MSIIVTNLKHFSVTFLILLMAVVLFGLYIGADAHLFEDKLAYHLEGETHVFFENDQMVRKVLKGNNDDGFYVESHQVNEQDTLQLEIPFPADKSVFTVNVELQIDTPDVTYKTGQPIIAISDIESGFGAFKSFLLKHDVADDQMNWKFGKGHLVLLGDFVDRGASTTQVLWSIYKLEQSAKLAGGRVHYIIGNHEIKNMQGNFQSADEKYFYIAGILGKQQYELYSENAFLGRWMASKNVVEIINDVAFVHGGIHPKIAQYDMSLEEINEIVRQEYRQLYFTPQKVTKETFLRSSTTGPAWYRGYFKEDLTQADVEQGLTALGANAVVVGHTLHSEVNGQYNNKVFAIDVRHPKDYLTSFPLRCSEGLLVQDNKFYRLKCGDGIEAL